MWFIKCVYDHSSYPAYNLQSVLVTVDDLSLIVGLHDLVNKAYCISFHKHCEWNVIHAWQEKSFTL